MDGDLLLPQLLHLTLAISRGKGQSLEEWPRLSQLKHFITRSLVHSELRWPSSLSMTIISRSGGKKVMAWAYSPAVIALLGIPTRLFFCTVLRKVPHTRALAALGVRSRSTRILALVGHVSLFTTVIAPLGTPTRLFFGTVLRKVSQTGTVTALGVRSRSIRVWTLDGHVSLFTAVPAASRPVVQAAGFRALRFGSHGLTLRGARMSLFYISQ